MKRTAICFGGVIILLCVLVPMMSYATQIFLVRGLVTDANENPIDGLDVTVENTSRSIPTMTVRTGEESGNGIYSVLFFNFPKTVAESGDEIQITVAQEGEVLAEVTHILTDHDITASGAVIDIQIESRVPAPILNSVVSDSGIITGGTIVRLLGENLQERYRRRQQDFGGKLCLANRTNLHSPRRSGWISRNCPHQPGRAIGND